MRDCLCAGGFVKPAGPMKDPGGKIDRTIADAIANKAVFAVK